MRGRGGPDRTRTAVLLPVGGGAPRDPGTGGRRTVAVRVPDAEPGAAADPARTLVSETS